MYLITIADSINRILKTPVGSRVMRPLYGSRLYLLRDRKFSKEWQLLATRYVFEAISINEPRVKVDRVNFDTDPVKGTVQISVHLTNGETVEVTND
ncbi:MAG TPA: baseplate assembly protein [Sulfurovum sp. UBA12169]|nr:MAG TPA: baseplate assembly protein [Sulfurovum sp. UBA12169]